ncbi:MAG: hypothetical protein H6624_08375 [Bdellovibrionaceae bacterium]|nr:hypothetical protein [Bdellovibrionales bacterium]MCB9084347.1 hypothetical protein [Pseudobdellovibrionaceae bacterium]
MQEAVQIKVHRKEVRPGHRRQLRALVENVQDIVPGHSRVKGFISKTSDFYEGRLEIRSRIGSFVAKAKSRNLFALIAKLQAKILRQAVNWREKRVSKKRYLRRRQLKTVALSTASHES